jgi:mannose-1-phosphate guanylyltransferase
VIRRAMVLAAGFGTRLAPLTQTTPKPLVPVAGRPFLDYVLAYLRDGGIREVVINLHHLGHLIEAHVGDGARHGMAVRYSREATILDTAGGIKHAEALLGDEPFVVANGDSLFETDLGALVDFHRARGGIGTMALRPDANAAGFGLVEIDDADRIRKLVGRPEGPAPGRLRGFMFPGMHVLEPEIFGHIQPDVAAGIVKVTYPAIIAQGVALFGHVSDARWINIDTAGSLAVADRELRMRPPRATP